MISASNLFNMIMTIRKPLLFLITVCQFGFLGAQDPERFREELSPFFEESTSELMNLQGNILFVGSSSIRMWKTIRQDLSNDRILNRGFGGSEMSDLLYYSDKLITRYKPSKIFIYEGDNDISNGEKPKSIIAEFDSLITTIRYELPKVPIILISAKPSISRWHLKRKYVKFNKKIRKFCEKNEVAYADIWTPMMDGKNLRTDLFIEDDLHLNNRGYDVWVEVLSSYL